MPVYNGEKYINAAIDSVLNQTFTDFELLIINDASIDQSLKIISSYTDKRIRILNNDKNRGIPYNRNLGLREAKGEYLCWTDCDDTNLPQRFEKQVKFLQTNIKYGGCGTWLSRFKDDKVYYITKALENPEEIKASLLFRPATVPNATAMLRLSEIKKYNLWYNEQFPISEDYDFIFRCSRYFDFSNLPEVLYQYRDSDTSIMKQFEAREKKSFEIQKTIYKIAFADLSINPSESDFWVHQSLCSQRIFKSFSEFTDCYDWIKKLEAANRNNSIYDTKSFEKILGDQFLFAAKKASKFGMATLNLYVRNSLRNNWKIGLENFMKLTVRCILKHDKFEFRRT